MQHSSMTHRAGTERAANGGFAPGRTHRHGMEGDRRPRSHARAQRCHELRCEEADEEIRELLRRF